MSVTSSTMTIDAHFTGPHSGTERFEAWLKNTIAPGAVYERLLDVAVGGVANLSAGPITALPPGVPHDVACRLTRSGAAQAGSTSSDPTTWPAGHRQAGVQLLLDDPVDDGTFLGDAIGGPGISTLYVALQRTPSDSHDLTPHGGGFDDPDWADIRYETEYRTTAGPGAWTPLNGFYNNETSTAHNLGFGRFHGIYNADVFDLDTDTIGLQVNVEPLAGQTVDIRIRRVAKNPVGGAVLQTSAWLVFAAEVIPA